MGPPSGEDDGAWMTMSPNRFLPQAIRAWPHQLFEISILAVSRCGTRCEKMTSWHWLIDKFIVYPQSPSWRDLVCIFLSVSLPAHLAWLHSSRLQDSWSWLNTSLCLGLIHPTVKAFSCSVEMGTSWSPFPLSKCGVGVCVGLYVCTHTCARS